jgi:hypothetical protein
MTTALLSATRALIVSLALARVTACSNDDSQFAQTKSAPPVEAPPPPTPQPTAISVGPEEATSSANDRGASAPPRNAIRQGSFTAWLERQDTGYIVVIQVRVADADDYTVADLSGEVVGTDGYRQDIGLHDDGLDAFRTYDGGAELRMFVPAGEPSVHDVIDVTSSRLHERQRLDITF